MGGQFWATINYSYLGTGTQAPLTQILLISGCAGQHHRGYILLQGLGVLLWDQVDKWHSLHKCCPQKPSEEHGCRTQDKGLLCLTGLHDSRLLFYTVGNHCCSKDNKWHTFVGWPEGTGVAVSAPLSFTHPLGFCHMYSAPVSTENSAASSWSSSPSQKGSHVSADGLLGWQRTWSC